MGVLTAETITASAAIIFLLLKVPFFHLFLTGETNHQPHQRLKTCQAGGKFERTWYSCQIHNDISRDKKSKLDQFYIIVQLKMSDI